MSPVRFLNRKYSYYLGEQRPLLQIIEGYESVPSPTPTPSVTPTHTPTPTPTTTPTPTPSATPNLFIESVPFGVTTNAGFDTDLTGTTFGITYNSVEYLTNNYGGAGTPLSPYYATNCRNNIETPSPGVIYDFQLTTIEPGYILTGFDWGNGNYGGFDRVKVTTGSVIGAGLWSANTQYYSGATLMYEDTASQVNKQSPPTPNAYGCYADIIIGDVNYPVFFVQKENYLTTEANQPILTESGLIIRPEQQI